MKIQFDSNVWRHISSPKKFPNDPDIDYFKKIRNMIYEGKIEPYISETVFTIESINRKNRKKFISNYKSQINIKTTVSGNSTSNSIRMGSNSSQHPGNHPILQEHLNDAISLGFRIVRCPRIAGITNPEIETLRYKLYGQELERYHDKLFLVGEHIEEKKAGIYHIKKIGEKYDRIWFNGIEKAPTEEWGNIANAMAEWADGDSVAISIALGCEFFCTRDVAKGAGIKSVLSQNNLTWLKNEYGFSTISPKDLSEK